MYDISKGKWKDIAGINIPIKNFATLKLPHTKIWLMGGETNKGELSN